VAEGYHPRATRQKHEKKRVARGASWKRLKRKGKQKKRERLKVGRSRGISKTEGAAMNEGGSKEGDGGDGAENSRLMISIV